MTLFYPTKTLRVTAKYFTLFLYLCTHLTEELLKINSIDWVEQRYIFSSYLFFFIIKFKYTSWERKKKRKKLFLSFPVWKYQIPITFFFIGTLEKFTSYIVRKCKIGLLILVKFFNGESINKLTKLPCDSWFYGAIYDHLPEAFFPLSIPPLR